MSNEEDLYGISESTAVNPYDMYTDKRRWVSFEYHNGRGSRQGLNSFATRRILLKDFEDCGGDFQSTLAVVKFLLKLGGPDDE